MYVRPPMIDGGIANVRPAPSARVLLRDCLVSLRRRIRSRSIAPAKMEIRASRAS